MICECGNQNHIYDLSCLSCCVRLVKSARPSRTQQEAMLLHIQVEPRRSDNAHTRRDSDRAEFNRGLCREEVREAERMGLL